MSDFEDGRCWAQYLFMEDEFLQFQAYVPYTEGRTNVFSPRLASMLLEVCSYIDSIFKLMARFERFKDDPLWQRVRESEKKKAFRIRYALDASEQWYKLSVNNSSQIVAKLRWHGPKEMRPFEDCGTKEPVWWDAYNDIKHSWSSDTIDKANMDNVLNALAGAFLLNAVHYPSIAFLDGSGDIRYFGEDRYSAVRFQTDPYREEWFKEHLQKAISNRGPFDYTHIIETQLFIFRYSSQGLSFAR